jgi:hypothetical protein
LKAPQLPLTSPEVKNLNNATTKRMIITMRSQSSLLPQITTNPRDSLSLARFMISLSKRKIIQKTLSPDSSTSLRDSINPRNTIMLLLSINRKIHRKVIINKNNPHNRKIPAQK